MIDCDHEWVEREVRDDYRCSGCGEIEDGEAVRQERLKRALQEAALARWMDAWQPGAEEMQ